MSSFAHKNVLLYDFKATTKICQSVPSIAMGTFSIIHFLHYLLGNSSINNPPAVDFESSNSICEEVEPDKEDSPSVFDEPPRQPAHTAARCKSNLKLLLSKGSIFVLGAVLLVAAGIVSQYHPPDSIISGNFSQCST